MFGKPDEQRASAARIESACGIKDHARVIARGQSLRLHAQRGQGQFASDGGNLVRLGNQPFCGHTDDHRLGRAHSSLRQELGKAFTELCRLGQRRFGGENPACRRLYTTARHEGASGHAVGEGDSEDV